MISALLKDISTAEWILNFLLRCLLISIVSWGLLKILKKSIPPMRSMISLLTLIAIILMPFITLISPTNKGYLFITNIHLPYLKESVSASSDEQNPASMKARATKDENRAGMLASAESIVQIINVIGFIWLIGSIFMIIRLFQGLAFVHVFKRRIVKSENGKIESHLACIKRFFPSMETIQAYVSTDVKSPLTIGFFKPIVVLPESLLKKLKNEEIESILIHEISHIYHRDHIGGIVQRLAIILNWWNPFVHRIATSFSVAREEVCDNHVLEYQNPGRYAECLLNVIKETKSLISLPTTIGMATPRYSLEARIKSILSRGRKMETKLKKAVMVSLSIAALCALSIVISHGFTLSAQNVDEKIKSEQDVGKVESSEKNDDVIEYKDIDLKVKPRAIKKVKPKYPEEARKARQKGVVFLKVEVDELGKVSKIRVMKGENKLFNNSAVEAVKQWKFKPLIINGKARKFVVPITINFVLN